MEFGTRGEDDVAGLGVKRDTAVAWYKFAGQSQAVGSCRFVLGQHNANLLALMQEELLQHRFHRAAAAVATLLDTQDGQTYKVDTGSSVLQPLLHRLTTALEGGWEVLQRCPQEMGHEAVRRYLRAWHGYAPTPAAREAAALELAHTCLLQGDLARAYDLLQAPPQGRSDRRDRFTRASLCGQIKHLQWYQALEKAAAQQPPPASRGATGADQQPGTHAAPGVFQAYRYNEAALRRLDAGANEAAKQAAHHLQEALSLQPDAVLLGWLLFQLCAAQGRHDEAARAAANLAAAAPLDPDALALQRLAAVAQERAGADAEAMVQLLRCDPSSAAAAGALVKAYEAGWQSTASPAPVAEGLALFLDTCQPARRPGPVAGISAWRTLASALAAASDAAARLASPAPERTEDSAGISGAAGWTHGDDAWAVREVLRVVEVLKERQCWWDSYHFHTRQLAGGQGTGPCADAGARELLISKAAAAAFVLGPSNDFTAGAAASLKDAVAGEAASSVQAAAGAQLAAAGRAARALWQAEPVLEQLCQAQNHDRQPGAGSPAAGAAAMDTDATDAVHAGEEETGSEPSAESDDTTLDSDSEASGGIDPMEEDSTAGMGTMEAVDVGWAGVVAAAADQVAAEAGEAGGFVADMQPSLPEPSLSTPHLLPLPEQWWWVFPQRRRHGAAAHGV